MVLVNADGDGSGLFQDRVHLDDAFRFQVAAGERQRDEATRDRGGACAAIGLQNVAVDRDLVFAEGGEIDDGAQRAADQALDFLRAAGLLAGSRFAAAARMRGAWQHAVFGRHPACALTLHPARNTLFPARGAQDMRIAELGKARAFGIARHAGFQADVAQLVEGASGWADKLGHGGGPLFCAA